MGGDQKDNLMAAGHTEKKSRCNSVVG